MQRFNKKMHLTNRDAQELFDSLAPKMMALCLRYMGDRSAAEDVLQDGFVTLFSKIEDYSGEGSFEGWARKIFVNTALMSLRKKDALRDSGSLEVLTSRPSEGETQIQALGYKELMGLVAELPPMYRTAFNLFVVEGYSHKEIAQALGITEATSRSHVQRARAYLQEKIKNR